MDWEEFWSYIIGFFGTVLPILCEGITVIFAMLIVVVTFLFITLPAAKKNHRREGK